MFVRTIFSGAPDRGGAIHFEKYRRLGKNMPAAIFIGADPVQYLVAPSRYGPDELAVAGGIRGEAVELVKCETLDLEVPASAEIVIEGEVLTDGSERTRYVAYVPGFPTHPMSTDEIETKARELVQPALGKRKADRLIDLCADLDRLQSVDPIIELMRFDPKERSAGMPRSQGNSA